MEKARTSRGEELHEFLSKALLTVIRLARNPNRPDLDQALVSLHRALSDNAGLDRLELAMQALMGEIVKSEFNWESAIPMPDAHSAEVDPALPTPDVLFMVKDAYLEFLKGLELDLDHDYLQQVTAVRKNVSQARDLQQLFSYRSEMEETVRRFAEQVFDERKKAARFIAEVAKSLTALEQYLLSSVRHFQDNYKANIEFSTKLESEITNTETAVRDSRQLERLKKLVLTKMNFMGRAIKDKQRQDKIRLETDNREMGDFRKKFGGIQKGINKVQNENRELLHRLRYDFLTGALSRMAYEEVLTNEINRFNRYRRPFSLVMFDLDNFKHINDTHGHLIGDKCLKALASSIKTVLRRNDTLARYGGDEFVILLPETSRDKGIEAVEKIRQTIETTDFVFQGQKIPITISIGLTAVTKQDSVDTVIGRADTAMLSAKKKGRNQISIL